MNKKEYFTKETETTKKNQTSSGAEDLNEMRTVLKSIGNRAD